MARVLLITSDTAGRVAIVCELASRLEQAGHTPMIASPGSIDELIARHGRPYTKLESQADPTATVVTAQLRSLEPDLILCDLELSYEVMAAYAVGTRLALWTTLFSVWKRPGLPPLHRTIIPGTGWSGSRLGIEWAWLRYRTGRSLGRWRRRLTAKGKDRIGRLRQVAETTGFPFDEEVMLHDWLVPFTFRNIPVLVCNTLELEFPHEPHPAARYVGPVLVTPPQGTGTDDDNAKLQRLFERRRNGETEALVYCAFGAWHKGDDEPFLRRVFAAAELSPSWDFVVGLGARSDPTRLHPVPTNVHLLTWAPQREILDHADLAIHHGGVTSVNECAAAGVPMLVYPFQFLDQGGNAARVAHRGLGVIGDRANDSPAKINERLLTLLTGDDFAASTARAKAAITQEHHDNRALDAIVDLLVRRK